MQDCVVLVPLRRRNSCEVQGVNCRRGCADDAMSLLHRNSQQQRAQSRRDRSRIDRGCDGRCCAASWSSRDARDARVDLVDWLRLATARLFYSRGRPGNPFTGCLFIETRPLDLAFCFSAVRNPPHVISIRVLSRAAEKQKGRESWESHSINRQPRWGFSKATSAPVLSFQAIRRAPAIHSKMNMAFFIRCFV